MQRNIFFKGQLFIVYKMNRFPAAFKLYHVILHSSVLSPSP